MMVDIAALKEKLDNVASAAIARIRALEKQVQDQAVELAHWRNLHTTTIANLEAALNKSSTPPPPNNLA